MQFSQSVMQAIHASMPERRPSHRLSLGASPGTMSGCSVGSPGSDRTTHPLPKHLLRKLHTSKVIECSLAADATCWNPSSDSMNFIGNGCSLSAPATTTKTARVLALRSRERPPEHPPGRSVHVGPTTWRAGTIATIEPRDPDVPTRKPVRVIPLSIEM